MIRFWLAHNDPCLAHRSERRDVYILTIGVPPSRVKHGCSCILFRTGLCDCVEVGRFSTEEWEKSSRLSNIDRGHCAEIAIVSVESGFELGMMD